MHSTDEKYYLLIFITIVSCPCFNVIFPGIRESVSILGDSYSTYEGYLTPQHQRSVVLCKNGQIRKRMSPVSPRHGGGSISKKTGINCVSTIHIRELPYLTRAMMAMTILARSFITRMDNLGCPDIIFMFGATNDSWAGSR
jgi:hypothetical protein